MMAVYAGIQDYLLKQLPLRDHTLNENRLLPAASQLPRNTQVRVPLMLQFSLALSCADTDMFDSRFELVNFQKHKYRMTSSLIISYLDSDENWCLVQ